VQLAVISPGSKHLTTALATSELNLPLRQCPDDALLVIDPNEEQWAMILNGPAISLAMVQ
jgi:hypothetical protein